MRLTPDSVLYYVSVLHYLFITHFFLNYFIAAWLKQKGIANDSVQFVATVKQVTLP